MPKAAVFFPAICLSFLLRLLRFAFLDGYLVLDGPLARYLGGLSLDSFLFLLGMHGALQSNRTVLSDDLDVVSVSRQRLIGDNRAPNLGRDLAVAFVFFLLIRGRLLLTPV